MTIWSSYCTASLNWSEREYQQHTCYRNSHLHWILLSKLLISRRLTLCCRLIRRWIIRSSYSLPAYCVELQEPSIRRKWLICTLMLSLLNCILVILVIRKYYTKRSKYIIKFTMFQLYYPDYLGSSKTKSHLSGLLLLSSRWWFPFRRGWSWGFWLTLDVLLFWLEYYLTYRKK